MFQYQKLSKHFMKWNDNYITHKANHLLVGRWDLKYLVPISTTHVADQIFSSYQPNGNLKSLLYSLRNLSFIQ